MSIDDDLTFIEHNLQFFAPYADGIHIDPNVRPKNKRKQWTVDSYTQALREGIEWWRAQDDATKRKYLHSAKEYAMQAMQGEFPQERARWLYALFMGRPDKALEAEDRAKKAQRRQIRDAQHDMSYLDIGYRCTECGKFAHERDSKNNKRHEKKEVCTCGGVSGPQQEMKDLISQYRAELKEQKRIKKEKQKRVPK